MELFKPAIALVTFAVLGLSASPAAAQPCQATTQQELLNALGNSSCTEIVVPSHANISLTSTVALTSANDGLRLIIEGRLTWHGATSDSTCVGIPVIISISGAEQITIEGAGSGDRLMTSNYLACQQWQPAPGSTQTCDPQICTSPSGGVISPCHGIVISGASHDITIKNLNFSQLASAIEFNNNQIHTIRLIDLNAQNLRGYGVFGACDHTVIIDNCHVSDAYGQHGFRFYANEVTINDSSANNTHSTGFWMVVGDSFTVNGFVSTGQRTQVGPNHVEHGYQGESDERVRNADISNVTILGTAANDKMQINLGTIGAWFNDISNQINETIGLGPIGVERPLNRVYWGSLSGSANFGTHACVGP